MTRRPSWHAGAERVPLSAEAGIDWAMAGEAMAGEAMAGEAMAGEAMAGEAMAGRGGCAAVARSATASSMKIRRGLGPGWGETGSPKSDSVPEAGRAVSGISALLRP